MTADIDLFERRLLRETSARKQAEALLEQKSLELYREAQQREQAVLALRESEERYRLLVELSPDAILIESEGRIIFANTAAHELFMARSPADLDERGLLDLAAPSCRQAVIEAIARLEQAGFCPTVEEQALRLDGTAVDVAVTRLSFTHAGKAAIQMVARDISERKRLEEQLQYQASHDSLTGLANRRLMHERLREAVQAAARDRRAVWLVFIDLDGFKFINDSLGHKAGDLTLNVIAERLRSIVRDFDTVARLGGDEFVLLLPDSAGDLCVTDFVQRVSAAVAQPLHIGDHEFALSCSIGVAAYPADGTEPDTLVERADTAMYRAKQAGRNNVQFYTATMNELVLERLQLESALRGAIERCELSLHYQPQLDVRTGQIVGMEALLRWRHPELGLVPPSRFICVAEETGLIVPIGAWVLQRACMQARAWQLAGFGTLRIAVNLSARQFAQPDLVASISAVLDDTGLEATYLELELTESMLMVDVERAVDVLRDLRALGTRAAIDDFGTGYSSLSYLKRLPIDVLKVDQSFVRDIATDSASAAIVSSIVALARHLELRVVAEGVETSEQATCLQRQGCNEMQGFLFSPAVTAEAFEQLLRQGARPPHQSVTASRCLVS